MKLLASDFDGTLFFSHLPEKILLSDVEAILKFQKQGNLFGVCSGRSLIGITACTPASILYNFYIVSSGACVFDQNKKVLFSKNLEFNTIREVLTHVPDDTFSSYQTDQILYLKNQSPTGEYSVVIRDINELPQNAIRSMSLHFPGKPEVAMNIVKNLRTILKGKAELYQNVDSVDICPAGCSKGAGIEIVQQYYGLCRDQIAAIGDSFNDISMLEKAGTPVTFQRSDVKIRRKSTHQVKQLCECIDLLLE